MTVTGGVTLANVNEDIRAQVRAAMKQKGLTQQALADQMGVERVYVNRMLTGDTSKLPGRWEDMLKALDLELTVKPKAPERES